MVVVVVVVVVVDIVKALPTAIFLLPTERQIARQLSPALSGKAFITVAITFTGRRISSSSSPAVTNDRQDYSYVEDLHLSSSHISAIFHLKHQLSPHPPKFTDKDHSLQCSTVALTESTHPFLGMKFRLRVEELSNCRTRTGAARREGLVSLLEDLTREGRVEVLSHRHCAEQSHA